MRRSIGHHHPPQTPDFVHPQSNAATHIATHWYPEIHPPKRGENAADNAAATRRYRAAIPTNAAIIRQNLYRHNGKIFWGNIYRRTNIAISKTQYRSCQVVTKLNGQRINLL